MVNIDEMIEPNEDVLRSPSVAATDPSVVPTAAVLAVVKVYDAWPNVGVLSLMLLTVTVSVAVSVRAPSLTVIGHVIDPVVPATSMS